MMKYAAILILVFTLPVMAGKVTFDEKYSVVFPDGWKKPDQARKDALVYQETEKGDASFAVAKLALPENAKADLKGTLNSMIEGFKKSMKVVGDPAMKEGAIDGKKAQFASVIVEADGQKMGFYLVAIDAKDRVFILQATLPAGASDKSREDCMKLIQSFKEE
ncbi:hypothetical protein NT6N_14530 [Oceaniferula spumae]|uniref:PsbP C-terminal domain-containing protein n=1 Tax=Oceaniferula spumae TaxID=2979115 RepID=A0AAT9FKF4_9BACT